MIIKPLMQVPLCDFPEDTETRNRWLDWAKNGWVALYEGGMIYDVYPSKPAAEAAQTKLVAAAKVVYDVQMAVDVLLEDLANEHGLTVAQVKQHILEYLQD